MKIVRDDLPTEGVTIAGIRFLPGRPAEVSDEIGKELIKRKGFREAGKKGGVSNASDRRKD